MADSSGSQSALSSSSWTRTQEGISVYFVIFMSLLAMCLVLSKLLHDRPVLASFLPEAGMIILVGMLAGFIVQVLAPNDVPNAWKDEEDEGVAELAQSLLSFSPNIFFVALLPPIIFNSGYHLRRDLFFRHITPICLFACLGTIISALVIAGALQLVVQLNLTGNFSPRFTELMTFGALVSATDPVSTLAVFQSKRVDPHLFYLVFGESVLNDAVGLLLFLLCAKFVQRDNPFEKVIGGIFEFFLDFAFAFAGSLLLGVLFGVGAAFLLKRIDMRKTTLIELSLYILIMYVPFLIAEILKLSGIVTILFTGIAARRYIVPNLSEATEANSDVFFRLAAHIAESSIFLELGLSVFGLAGGNFKWQFVLWALLACLIGRAANVYPIAFVFNRSLRRGDDDKRERFIDHSELNLEGGAAAAARAAGGEGDVVKGDAGNDSDSTTNSRPSHSNLTKKDLRISANTAHMLWFSGLRGAVAYACARQFPNTFGHTTPFVVTTMFVVLATVFFMGGTTEIMLTFLRIPMDVDEDEYLQTHSRDHILTGFLAGFETNYIRRCVIRDFETVRRSEMMGRSSSMSPPGSEDVNTAGAVVEYPDAYQQHEPNPEITRNESPQPPPENKVKAMGFPNRQSLYDYGSH